MGAIWLLAWFGQSVTGRTSYNAALLEHREDPISYFGYLGTADFWERTLQNWQSEFLAVGSMAILSVYLRQRGSPESKRDARGDGHNRLSEESVRCSPGQRRCPRQAGDSRPTGAD